MVTGDDTPAGGGNSGGFGPFNGQLTNESQTVAVAGATGGTFTLTFDGQTTAPIAVPARQRGDRVGARGALEPRRRGRDRARGTTDGQLPRQQGGAERPADDRRRLRPDRHHADAHGRDGDGQQRPEHQHPGRGRAVQRTARRRSAHGAEHGRPPRQAAADQGQGRRHHAGREEHVRRRVHRPGRQPLPGRHGPDAARGLRDGLPEPVPDHARQERRRVRQRLLARLARSPQQFRGPAGTGRFEIVRKPANYGWPLCYKTDLAVLQVGLQHVDPAAERGGARAPRVRQPDPRARRTPRAGSRTAARRSTRASSTGLRSPTRRSGTRTATTRRRRTARRARRASRSYGPAHRPTPVGAVPAALPGALHRRRRPARARRRTTTTRPTRTRRSSRPTGTGRGSSASSRRTRCARSGMDSNGNDPQDQQHAARAARCRRRRRGRGSATTRWTWSSVPTARSTCSPTATASSPSTRTPG